MDELIENPVEGQEPGEGHNPKQQELDDATLEPRATVEQTGDYQQAEAIQNTLTGIVDNAPKSAGEVGVIPIPLPSPAEQGASEGKSPARENLSATPQTIPHEDDSLTGSLPQLRGDLDQLAPTKQSDHLDATPIPLPGQQEPAEATPIPLPGQEGVTGRQPEARDDLDQLAPTEQSDHLDATPIPLPGQQEPAEATPIPLPGQDGVAGRQPEARDDLDQVTVAGTDSPGGEEATPIPLPGQRGTASQEAVLEEGAETSTTTTPRGSVAMDDDPPPPPDLGTEQAPGSVVTEDSEALPDAPLPDTGPEAAGEGASPDESALPDNETAEGGEVEEVWNPPDVYMYVGQNGAITVVDSDGNPYGNPPIVKTHDGQNYYAFYYGHEDKAFDIPYYSGTLQEGWYLHTADDGTLTVIDEKGNPVQNPPIVATHDGQNYYAYYPGDPTKMVDITNYCPPWDKIIVGIDNYGGTEYSPEKPDWYLYTDQDGKQTIVDGEGNPVPNPPCVGTHDGQNYYAYYPGQAPYKILVNGTETLIMPFLDLPAWTPPFNKTTVINKGGKDGISIEKPSWFVFVGQDGKLSVVDEKGVPVKNPPVIATHDGQNYYAYYPGGGDKPSWQSVNNKYIVENIPMIDLPLFKGSLQEDWFALTGKDGKVTIVDRDGNPVSCPPIVNTHDGQNYYAYYPGDETKMVDLKPYMAPLQGRYLQTGQDGTMTVVDSSGKPLTAQPLIGTHDGIDYYAYYPGDPTQYALTHYLPPSSKSKSGSSS